MKVICDTHIWYYLGDGSISSDSIDNENKLVATFVNIDELARTHNHLTDFEKVRAAIQALFKNQSQVIYEQPLGYLKKLADPDFEYDIMQKHGDILKFTEAIANGDNIDNSKKDDFEKFSKGRVEDLQKVADSWNEEALKIKTKIKDKKSHRNFDTKKLVREFISLMVALSTNKIGLPENFDWAEIELFENTLKHFFIELEISQMKIQANDWYDLFQLIYVQPGAKIWLQEKRWITLIKKAGMGKYLYKQ